MLWLAAFCSAAASAMEAGTAYILGWVVDGTANSGPGNFFDGSNLASIVGAVAFFLLALLVLFGLSAATNAIVVRPNANTLVLSRLHRWTLGQSVSFFDDDFSGRIAQKQMQAARALTDAVSEFINVVVFALPFLVGSLILLTTIDGRITAVFLLWLLAYFAIVAWFLPRIRTRLTDRAGTRAMLTGQAVDTITNIETVKLFAHVDHEDQAALVAMESFRQSSLRFGHLSALFRLCRMTLAGALPVLPMGGMLTTWQVGSATEGDIVAASAVSIRIAQMTGWVSFTLMAIYSNTGEAAHSELFCDNSPILPNGKGERTWPPQSRICVSDAQSMRCSTQSFRPARLPKKSEGIVGRSIARSSAIISKTKTCPIRAATPV